MGYIAISAIVFVVACAYLALQHMQVVRQRNTCKNLVIVIDEVWRASSELRNHFMELIQEAPLNKRYSHYENLRYKADDIAYNLRARLTRKPVY